MSRQDPFELLGLSDTATEAQVKAAWHLQSMTNHPDLGGDPQVFMATHEAYLRCLDYVATRPCAHCGGKGYVDHVHGFFAIKMICMHCKKVQK